MQHLVAGQHLRRAGIGLAAFADGGEELAVLQLDAVHADRHLADVDLLVLAVEQVVVAGDVGAGVADVAEEGAQRPVVVEGQAQRADGAVGGLELDAHVHRDAQRRVDRAQFRLDKLYAALKLSVPSILHIYAEFVHFAFCEQALNETDKNTLTQILTYGPKTQTESPRGELFLVIPRIGTISPWASRATDIANNCGLKNVLRIERGIVYYVTTKNGQALSETEKAAFRAVIHDRMTEAVVYALQDAEKLYHHADPKPLNSIDIIQGGKAALEAANDDMGLALSPDEVDYLLDNYNKMGRNPTDVELMMFAQANSEHCRHKIFNADWVIDGVQQEISLFGMIRNTHKLNPGSTVVAYSDNSSIVKGQKTKRFYPQQNHAYGFVEDDMHYLMKVETHNHPTAISPFAGAATGAGGEIRDEGATGIGSKPKAGLTGFSVSNLNIPNFTQAWEKPYGKPSRIATPLQIMIDGPLGGAAYNNEFGRPNIAGYFRTFELETNNEVRGYHRSKERRVGKECRSRWSPYH